MTLEEAKKIAAIVEDVDGGCPVCVGCAVERLRAAFPAFVWSYSDMSGGPVIVTERAKEDAR